MANWNKNSGWGQAMINMVASRVPAFGNLYLVFNSANSDEANYQHWQEIATADPDGRIRFYTSLESAYAACESNNNDVVLLDGNSTHVVAKQMTIAKNRIHFFIILKVKKLKIVITMVIPRPDIIPLSNASTKFIIFPSCYVLILFPIPTSSPFVSHLSWWLLNDIWFKICTTG